MKKFFRHILLAFSILFLLPNANAQTYINDNYFGNWIYSHFPTCITYDTIVNQWQLDYSCPDIIADTTMDISGQPIQDLSGIQYFVNLKYLNASGCQLMTLPASSLPNSLLHLDVSGQQSGSYGSTFGGLNDLPPNLTFLDCSNDPNMVSLPALPSSLVTLNCIQTPISVLPALPDSLEYLDVNTDYSLTSLPPLPAKLKYLDISHNNISYFTGNLPSHLTYLDCSYNGFYDSLPSLVNTSLNTLRCNNNYLPYLAPLPASLQYLDCSFNQLTSLPAFNDSLVYIYCQNNQIDSLPAFPLSMRKVICNDNQLTALPLLNNGLRDLECHRNIISSLPSLPASLDTLYCEDNALTVLPALPTGLEYLVCGDSILTGLPVLPVSLKLLEVTGAPRINRVPQFPSGLRNLELDFLKITSIPDLPDSLLTFTCYADSDLTCLPVLSQTIVALSFAGGTPITCMPNRLPYCNIFSPYNPNLLPLCNPMSGCVFNYNIWGNVHLDTAQTGGCISDSLHNATQLTGVKLLLSSGGNVLQQTYSNRGQYSFKTHAIQNYKVSVDTTSDYFLKVACPDSFARVDNMTATDTIFCPSGFWFAVQR